MPEITGILQPQTKTSRSSPTDKENPGKGACGSSPDPKDTFTNTSDLSTERRSSRYLQLANGQPRPNLPELSAQDFIKRYDTLYGRVESNTGDKALVIEEVLGDPRNPLHIPRRSESFLKDFLSLTSEDQKKVMSSMDTDAKEYLVASLQTRFIFLAEERLSSGPQGSQRANLDQEIKRTQDLLSSPQLCQIERGGWIFRTKIQAVEDFQKRMPHIDSSADIQKLKAIHAGWANSRTESSWDLSSNPHVIFSGKTRDAQDYHVLSEKLADELAAGLQPQKKPSLKPPEIQERSHQEIAARINEKYEKELRDIQNYRGTFQATVKDVLEQTAAVDSPRSDLYFFKSWLKTSKNLSDEQIKNVKIEVIGTAQPGVNGRHLIRATLPGEKPQIFTRFNQSASFHETGKSDLPPSAILISRANDKTGIWEISKVNDGVTPDVAMELKASAAARDTLTEFVRNGDQALKTKIASGEYGSMTQYLERQFNLKQLAALPQLKAELAQAEASLKDLAAKPRCKEHSAFEDRAAGLKVLVSQLEQQKSQRDRMQQIVDKKKIAHVTDWQWEKGLQQIPASYVDAVTGAKIELPLFQVQTKSGIALLDLRDGGVYTGNDLKTAMKDFIDGNEYGIGYVKYSLDHGQSIVTQATFDGWDEFFSSMENVSAYIGYSAIVAGMVPSPDPVTKGYAAIAGLSAMAAGAVSNLRRIVSDAGHEREVDCLDVIGVAASAVGGGGGAVRGVSTLAKTSRGILIGTALSLDAAQFKISTARMHEQLDLDNPNLPQYVREERYHNYLNQAGLNAFMTLFLNRHQLKAAGHWGYQKINTREPALVAPPSLPSPGTSQLHPESIGGVTNHADGIENTGHLSSPATVPVVSESKEAVPAIRASQKSAPLASEPLATEVATRRRPPLYEPEAQRQYVEQNPGFPHPRDPEKYPAIHYDLTINRNQALAGKKPERVPAGTPVYRGEFKSYADNVDVLRTRVVPRIFRQGLFANGFNQDTKPEQKSITLNAKRKEPRVHERSVKLSEDAVEDQKLVDLDQRKHVAEGNRGYQSMHVGVSTDLEQAKNFGAISKDGKPAVGVVFQIRMGTDLEVFPYDIYPETRAYQGQRECLVPEYIPRNLIEGAWIFDGSGSLPIWLSNPEFRSTAVSRD